MTTAIVTQQPKEIQQWKSPSQIKQRVQAIQQLMNEVLKKDTDYGVIPGMPKGTKPSLWKPGSEQILAMFQIAVDPVVEDLSTEDCYRYRVTTRLTNVLTGEFLGAGIGEASTDETKYKWRRTYSKPEFDGSDPERRRIKHGRYKNGDTWNETEEMQVRQEPADLANTILKMAKKRSQIDATLTVTGASSMFEQDLEDLPEETRQEMAAQRQATKKQDKAVGDVMCSDCRAINGHLPSCIHRKTPAAAATAPPAGQTETQAPKTTTQTQETPQMENTEEFAVMPKAITPLVSKGKVPRPYLSIAVVDDMQDEWELFCWHQGKVKEALLAASPIGKLCVLACSKQVKQDRTYYALESIVSIDGVLYHDNVPESQ